MAWASNYSTRLRKLAVLHKRAIRVVAGATYGLQTNPIFSKLRLLRAELIKLMHFGEFMYRFDRGLLPPECNGFFSLVYEVHTYSIRNLIKRLQMYL